VDSAGELGPHVLHLREQAGRARHPGAGEPRPHVLDLLSKPAVRATPARVSPDRTCSTCVSKPAVRAAPARATPATVRAACAATVGELRDRLQLLLSFLPALRALHHVGMHEGPLRQVHPAAKGGELLAGVVASHDRCDIQRKRHTSTPGGIRMRVRLLR